MAIENSSLALIPEVVYCCSQCHAWDTMAMMLPSIETSRSPFPNLLPILVLWPANPSLDINCSPNCLGIRAVEKEVVMGLWLTVAEATEVSSFTFHPDMDSINSS